MRTLLLASIPLAALAACGARQVAPPDLGVTRVVLYQSGVAYVERAGTVTGGALTLPIRADQINDILATLVVIDRDGGGTSSVSLPIDQAAGDRLSDLPPEIRDAGGMVAILYAFRGADVTIDSPSAHVRGRIVGVEHIDSAPQVTVLDRRDTLIAIPIAEITQVDLLTDSLSTGLRRSLDHSLAQGEWKPTDVTVRFAREGAHDIVMAYVVEMPIWKPAYRVVVDDDQMLLQGWAVVDNTSGTDWNDVRLSLTAGTPISFRYDLHSPIFLERPNMTSYGVPNLADLAPPTPVAAARTRAASGPGAPMGAAVTAEAAPMFEMPSEEFSSYGEGRGGGASAWEADTWAGASAPAAEVVEAQGMFRFDIPGRVTVPDQSSTMVTLVNAAITGEDALIFQPDSAPASHVHPYRAISIDNTSGAPIQRAPIAIYNGSTFVGQGITPIVGPGESAVIPYAIETAVRVAQVPGSSSGDLRLTRIIDGVIYTESQWIEATTYEVSGSLDTAAPMMVKVPRYVDYELVASEDFDLNEVQTEQGYYLVPFELPARTDIDVTVEQRSRVASTIDAFEPATKQIFLAYLSSGDARPDVADALRPVVAMLEELATLERLYSETTQLQSEVNSRTNELRRNIAVLGDSPTNAELRRTLTERLRDQDDLSAELAGRLVTLSERRSAVRVGVSEALRAVSLTAE